MAKPTEFAERLRRVGLNDSQASRLLHRSRETISKWRTGRGEADRMALDYLDLVERNQLVIKAVRAKTSGVKG